MKTVVELEEALANGDMYIKGNVINKEGEHQAFENFQILRMSGDRVYIRLGGDWQEPMIVIFKVDGYVLTVEEEEAISMKDRVYKAIETERAYQEMQKNNPTSHVVEDFPLAAGMEAIQYNLRMANAAWYNEQAPYPDAMRYIRKIAGICVQMGEKYGMTERELPNKA